MTLEATPGGSHHRSVRRTHNPPSSTSPSRHARSAANAPATEHHRQARQRHLDDFCRAVHATRRADAHCAGDEKTMSRPGVRKNSIPSARGARFVEPGGGISPCEMDRQRRLAEPDENRRGGEAIMRPEGRCGDRQGLSPPAPNRGFDPCATSENDRAGDGIRIAADGESRPLVTLGSGQRRSRAGGPEVGRCGVPEMHQRWSPNPATPSHLRGGVATTPRRSGGADRSRRTGPGDAAAKETPTSREIGRSASRRRRHDPHRLRGETEE